jgi:hypothetical protein
MSPLRLVSSSTANAGAMRRRASSLAIGQMLNVPTSCWRRSDLQWNENFADFFETGTCGENPKALAASFSKGMGHRISQRLRRLKAGRSATVLGKGKELAAGFANLFRGATRGELRRQLARLPMKPGSGPVIALSFLDVAQDLATATDPASPIDIGGYDIPIQAARMLLAGAAQWASG